MNNPKYRKSLLPRLVAASVTGLLVGSASVHAVDPEEQLHSTEATATTDDNTVGTFQEVDENQDQSLVWSEIHSYYENELDRASWHETTVFSWFDTDTDRALDPREYEVFLTNLVNNPTARQEMLGDLAVEGPDDEGQPAPEATGPQGQREDIVLGDNEEGQETQNIVLENDPAPLSEQIDTEGSITDTPAQATADTGNTGAQGAEAANNWTSAGTRVDEQSGTSPAANEDQQQQLLSASGEELTPVTELSVDEIKDQPVQNLSGTEVGQVNDVVLRQDGSEAGLVISLDGANGSSKEVFVGLDDVGAAQDYLVWQTPLEPEQLRELPSYNESIFVSIQ